MPATRLSRSPIEVQHVRIQCARPFDDVYHALKAAAPLLDPTLAEDLMAARVPSSFFGQFGDPQVAAVGHELDRELEELLLAAAG